MTGPNQLENVTENNERSLKILNRAISLSLGEFSLVLVRCNYKRLRDHTLRQLRKLSHERYQIRELVLPPSVTNLYKTIRTHGYDESPSKHELSSTLFIIGLESVDALEALLTSCDQARDEFPKHLSFPLVLWVNDEVLKKMSRFAPAFAHLAIPIKFEIATSELIDFLQKKTDSVFTTILRESRGKYTPWRCWLNQDFVNLKLELDSTLKDLQTREQVINPELEASLQFIFGHYDYASDRIDLAIVSYQKSLSFWRQLNNLERQGVLLFYIGLCYCRIADLHPGQRHRNLEEAWPYLLQCIDVFIQAKREDLVAIFITQLAEVLQRLEAEVPNIPSIGVAT